LHELPDFEVYTPSTLGEVLTYLSGAGKGSWLLAGGTKLIPEMRREAVRVQKVVDLSGVSDLRYIRRAGKTIRIGGLTTINQLLTTDRLDGRYRCFRMLGRHFGGVATRNMATVGGNLAAGSEGDLTEILLALDGRVTIRSAKGERAAEPAELGLAGDEVIVEARFEEPEGPVSTWFNKFEKRRQRGTGVITTTTLVKLGDDKTMEDVRIAVSRARGKEVGRVRGAESELKGKVTEARTIGRALDALESEIDPEGDYLGSVRFRKQVTRAMVREGLEQCLNELRNEREMVGSR
jgi:carbon-monoxide dehydrogenase medium subunit